MREEIRQQVKRPHVAQYCFALAALATSGAAQASFLAGDTLDAFANGLSWFILIVMPFAAIGLFLYVHVLPEVIAEKRHHPQKDSIKVLCILSLFFGGLLWPLAWLWAYTRPVGFRAAYGTEKHEDYYIERAERIKSDGVDPAELAHLRDELAAMAAKGNLPLPLKRLKDDLDAIAAGERLAPARVAESAVGGQG